MTLECINPFGYSVPGDQVEVPDGAVFDTFHWREVKPQVTKKGDK